MSKAQSIAEQIEAENYSLLLPAKSEQLRQYLGNDGLLSNEEICRALYDDALTKKSLREKVVQTGVTTDKKLTDQLTSHLWETHQSVKAVKHMLPVEGIDPKATYRLKLEDGQVQRVETKQTEGSDAPMPKVVVVSGNLLANFLHNYRLNRDMQLTIERLPAADQTQRVATESKSALTEKSVVEKNQVRPVKTDLPGKPLNVVEPLITPSEKATGKARETDTPKKEQGLVTIDWERLAPQLAAVGITREQLEKSGQLQQLLAGKQTAPVTYDQKVKDRYVSMTGKLRVVEANGQYKIRFQPIRDEKIVRALSIPKQIHGYTITPDDRANLIRTGELGRLVQLTDPKTKQAFQAFIGAEARSGQLIVTRQEQVKLPKSINGVALTQTQREMIGQGKAIRLDGLSGQNGQTFSAYVQVSAAKKGLNVTSVPDNAIKKTTDVKTALDLRRPSHKLEGTPSGLSMKTERTQKHKNAPAESHALREEVRQGPRLR